VHTHSGNFIKVNNNRNNLPLGPGFGPVSVAAAAAPGTHMHEVGLKFSNT